MNYYGERPDPGDVEPTELEKLLAKLLRSAQPLGRLGQATPELKQYGGQALELLNRPMNAAGGIVNAIEGNIPWTEQAGPAEHGEIQRKLDVAINQALAELANTSIRGQKPQRQGIGEALFPGESPLLQAATNISGSLASPPVALPMAAKALAGLPMLAGLAKGGKTWKGLLKKEAELKEAAKEAKKLAKAMETPLEAPGPIPRVSPEVSSSVSPEIIAKVKREYKRLGDEWVKGWFALGSRENITRTEAIQKFSVTEEGQKLKARLVDLRRQLETGKFSPEFSPPPAIAPAPIVPNPLAEELPLKKASGARTTATVENATLKLEKLAGEITDEIKQRSPALKPKRPQLLDQYGNPVKPTKAQQQAMPQEIVDQTGNPIKTPEGPKPDVDEFGRPTVYNIYKQPIKIHPPRTPGQPPAPPPIGMVSPRFAARVNHFKDLNRFEGSQISTTTYRHAAERVEGEWNGVLRQEALRPVEDANFNRVQEEYATTQEFKEILGGITERKWHQRLLGYNDSSHQIFLAQDMDKVTGLPRNTRPLTEQEQSVARWMRAKYDEYITRENAERAKVGANPIAYRKDYINHIWTKSIVDDIMGPDFIPELDAIANGTGKGKTPWTTYALERKGAEGFNEDGVTAFLAYMPRALANVHMLEPVARAKGYVQHLPPNARNYFDAWLNEGALGKESSIDKWFPRRMINVTSKITRRIASNLIGVNLGTAALQYSSLPHVAAMAGPSAIGKSLLSTVPGLGNLLSNVPKGAQQAEGLRAIALSMDRGFEFAYNNSKTLRLRTIESYEDIMKQATAAGKFEAIGNIPLHIGDRMPVVWAFNAGYIKARKMGMDHASAIAYADDFAAKTQAVYDRLNKSPIMRSRMFGATIGIFQHWTTAFANSIGYEMLFRPKVKKYMTMGGDEITDQTNAWKRLYTLGVFAGTAIGINRIYHAMGLRIPFDRLDAFVPFPNYLGPFVNPDYEAVPGRGASPVMAQTFYKIGKDIKDITQDYYLNDSTPRKRREMTDDLVRKLLLIGPRFGGNQLGKSMLGGRDVLRGYSYVKGKRLPIRTLSDKLSTIIWGPTGTSRAQKIFQGGK